MKLVVVLLVQTNDKVKLTSPVQRTRSIGLHAGTSLENFSPTGGDSGREWGTVGESGAQWDTVGHSGAQWGTVGHSGAQWDTVGETKSKGTKVFK